MTPERAIDICRRINARYFLALGLSEQPQLPPLEGVTLAEMLEAAEQVRKEDLSTRDHAKFSSCHFVGQKWTTKTAWMLLRGPKKTRQET